VIAIGAQHALGPISVSWPLERCQTRRLNFQHPYHCQGLSGSPILAEFSLNILIFPSFVKNPSSVWQFSELP
jgi:hypothetical protein